VHIVGGDVVLLRSIVRVELLSLIRKASLALD
jgi:hypothetical protein